MRRQHAFVLGGGGARGALQVGALRALLEAGLRPDLLVGASIGAANAAFLALRGLNTQTIGVLTEVWRQTSSADLLPPSAMWLTVRALFGRQPPYPAHRMQDFLVAHGLLPELRFRDIQHMRLILVAADLNSGRPVLYGQDPDGSILEGVLASTALPPWMTPLEKDGRFLIDGGTVSNLPIEPALAAGATEITALDLADERDVLTGDRGFGPFLGKLIYTVEQRQTDLELALAAAQGVPVTHIRLQGAVPVPLWDFRYTEDLLVRGYQITRQQIEKERSRPLVNRLRAWWRAQRGQAAAAALRRGLQPDSDEDTAAGKD